MPDADIIPLGDPERPLGTRGRPGRGTGSAKPSSSSRGLAGNGTSARTPKQRSAAPRQPQRQTPAQTPDQTPDQTPAQTPDQTALEAPAAEPSPLVTHATPRQGIPVVDWLAAFTSAAQELFGESWEPRLAQFLAFLRRRLTGDYSVDEFCFDP